MDCAQHITHLAMSLIEVRIVSGEEGKVMVAWIDINKTTPGTSQSILLAPPIQYTN